MSLIQDERKQAAITGGSVSPTASKNLIVGEKEKISIRSLTTDLKKAYSSSYDLDTPKNKTKFEIKYDPVEDL